MNESLLFELSFADWITNWVNPDPRGFTKLHSSTVFHLIFAHLKKKTRFKILIILVAAHMVHISKINLLEGALNKGQTATIY